MSSQYRPRILARLENLISPLSVKKVMDFGSGDGYFASNISRLSGINEVVPVDVVERKSSIVVPQIYDGERLPFDDASFDLVYSVDVIHHCHDPVRAIDDMMRCSKRYLLIKDHNYTTQLGRWTLAVLDELGNRRFGIPSPYLYQKNWQWTDHIESHGFRRIGFQYPMVCETGLFSFANKLQFVALWERQ